MKFYFTSQPANRLKNAFSNIKQYKIIDIDYIFESSTLDRNDVVHGFIIDSEIERMISEGSSSKKYEGVIYTNSKLDETIIEKVKQIIYKIEDKSMVDIFILDDYDVPKSKKFYKMVDNIIFFPIIKKVKTIKCKPITFPR